MGNLVVKAERVTRLMHGHFSYSPMPHTGTPGEAGKDTKFTKVWNPHVTRIVVGVVGALIVFGVICVIATIATATTLAGREASSSSGGPRLRVTKDKEESETVLASLADKEGTGSDDLHSSASVGGTNCCHFRAAECLACQANQTIAQLCLSHGHGDIDGCEGYCGLNEDSFTYPGGDLRSLQRPTAQACCAECRADHECTSWTWGKDPSSDDYSTCYLKDQAELRREPDSRYVSGLPGKDSLTFQIRTRHSLCLDVRSIQNSQGLHTCGRLSAKQQKWSYDRQTGQIQQADHDGLCLDVRADKKGSKVLLNKCSMSFLGQRWMYDSLTGQVENAFGLCLESEESRAVRMQPCKLESNQRWIFAAGSGAHIEHNLGKQTSTSSTSTVTVTESSTSTTISTTKLTTTTIVETTVMSADGFVSVADASLYCFSLMLPWGYEADLLRMQISERRSIFACEDFVVYSSVALDLGSGYTTERLNIDLHCPMGGQYYTALNTPIFLQIWDQVIEDGRFLFHEWTVKADPDCVFLPSRLRDIVRLTTLTSAVELGKGLFLNNCRFGLHGPLEVVSRRALATYGKGAKDCKQPPQEDVYLQHCLLSLGVTQMNQFNLLAEAACKSPEWQSCHGSNAAFHPFKGLDDYRECQGEAEKNGTWSESDLMAVKATAETIGVDPETAKLGIPLLEHTAEASV